MDERLFKQTDQRDAAETAALLRSLADDLEGGTGFDALAGVESGVGVPTAMTVDLEVDRNTETEQLELEIELVWDSDDERAVEAVTDAEPPESGGTADPDATVTTDTTVTPTGRAPAESGPASQATFELFRDTAGEWRWRLRHRNGNIVADSGEGYTRRKDAMNGLESVQRNAPGAEVEIED